MMAKYDISKLLYCSPCILRDCTNEVKTYHSLSRRIGQIDGMEEICKSLSHSIHEKYYEVVSKQPYNYNGILFSPGEVYSKSKIIELLNSG